jgi:hypothetical protein
MKIWYIVKTNEDHLLYASVRTTSIQHRLEAGAECIIPGNALKNDNLYQSYLH